MGVSAVTPCQQAELFRDSLYEVSLSLLLRALAIDEKLLPPIHPDLALYLENCSGLFVTLGQDAEAAEMRSRAAAIRAAHRANNPAG
jgi:hypothetical protein